MFVPTHNRSWEPEAVTLFAAASGFTDTRKRQCNTLIRQLKEAGIWTKLDALYVMAAHSTSAAKTNWKNPGTYDLTEINSPYFTIDVGFSGQNQNKILDTGFNPNTAGGNFGRNSSTIFGWYLDPNIASGTIGGELIGYTDDANLMTAIYPAYNDGKTYFDINNALIDEVNAGTISDRSGFWSLSRTGASAAAGYHNGSSVSSISSASVALVNSDIYVLARKSTGTAPFGSAAVAGFGAGLNATESASLYTAFNNYMQAVCQTPYAGPEDVISGAIAWYGFRASKRAHVGGNCINIIRASDSAEQTFTTVPGGGVDTAGLATFLNGTTGKATKVWDNTGGGSHCIQATDANRPSITLNSLHGFPTLTASGTTMKLACAAASFNGGVQTAIPWTQSGVGYQSQSAATYGTIIADQGDIGMFFLGTGQVSFYATGDHLFTASANAWHAVGWTSNSTSSLGIVDTTATGTFTNLNTANFNSRSEIEIVSDGGDPMTGGWMEVGVWPVAFSTTDHSNMSANQRTFWGF